MQLYMYMYIGSVGVETSIPPSLYDIASIAFIPQKLLFKESAPFHILITSYQLVSS